MVPFSKNDRYIGTSDKLANKLEGDGHHRLALWGLGGVGYDPYTA
jgi:hypothetical protein